MSYLAKYTNKLFNQREHMEKVSRSIEHEIYNISVKTEGVAHLLYYYDKHSSGPRDRDAMAGIAMILEDLAKQGRELSESIEYDRKAKSKAV